MFQPFKQLEGEQLSAVTIVQDYIQLHFDGPVINVHIPMSVDAGGATVRREELLFRNVLCGQITKVVRRVVIEDDEALTIVFDDDSRMVISLGGEDYTTAEALVAGGFRDGAFIVIRIGE